MRPGLRPVAISCDQDYYHDPFAPFVDARGRSENASDAPNVFRKPISMQDRELRTIGVLRNSWVPSPWKFALRVSVERLPPAPLPATLRRKAAAILSPCILRYLETAAALTWEP
jgi:hypothetical protein